MTRQYIDGRRASYVSSIALFLFAVFLLFAAIHAIEGTGGNRVSVDNGVVAQRETLVALQKQRTMGRDPAEIAVIDRGTAAAKASTAMKNGDNVAFATALNDPEFKQQKWRSDLPVVAHAIDFFR